MTNSSHPHGWPVVLTADRLLMSDFTVLLDGMTAAVQTTRVPRALMRWLLTRPMPAEGLAVRRAPLGLRRIEAALLQDGFDPDDVILVRPGDVRRAIGPATRVVGVSSGDPLGVGMTTGTFEGLAGGRAWTPTWFSALIRLLASLRRHFTFSVVYGGPGAWQFAERPDAQRDLGIDTVVSGYAERAVGGLFQALAAGRGAPPFLHASSPEAEAVPALRGPSSMGAVEVSRGCGLGCDFCSLARERSGHLPLDAIRADVETNVRGGVESVVLLAEDFFRYGAAGPSPEPDSVLALAEAVRQVGGTRLIQIDHAGVSSVVRFDREVLKALNTVLSGGRPGVVWTNLGVETASGELLAANGGRPKMLPFAPGDWSAAAEEAVRRLCDAGFVPLVSLVMGLPGETADDVERTTRLIDRLEGCRMAVFPLFFAPVRNGERPFGRADMTPAHWRLFRRAYAFNFRHMPGLLKRDHRAAGVSRRRSAVLQAAGRVQTLQWKARFILKTRRLRP